MYKAITPLRSLVVAAALALTSVSAMADYPERPLRVIVPFAAGGATDVIARTVAQAMSVRLGQSIVVENKAGANGNIGGAAAARSEPDGYTLLMATSSHAINASLYQKLSYSLTRDFAALAGPVPAELLRRITVELPVDIGKVMCGQAGQYIPLGRIPAGGHAPKRRDARAFRQRNPAVRGYIVEPERAAALAGAGVQSPAHRIQGGGYAMAELPLLAGIAVDGFLTVSDEEAMTAARRLAREEGIFAGFSSGANLAAAIKLLEGTEKGGSVAIVICDTGLKYLSTDLWAHSGDSAS